ncbi:MAG: hypothetical protein IKS83_09750 [Victivallales bacterium]|nr:hypothetical protein [Victivallales bacterium]
MGLLDDLTNLMGGARSNAEQEQDRQEAKAEVAKLDLDGIKGLIAKVTALIAGKNKDLASLQAQLKNLSPMDLLNGKGNSLKDQVASLLSSLSSLKTKLGVYEDAAKDKA